MCVTAALSTTAVALTTATPAQADPGCQNGGVYILWARGSGQTIGDVEAQRFQTYVQNGLDAAGITTHAWAELGNLDGNGIVDPTTEYPAVNVGWSIANGDYDNSVFTGVKELIANLNNRYALGPVGRGCNTETVVLGGFSQGADVLGWALSLTDGDSLFGYPTPALTAAARSHIGFVGTYGDPELDAWACPRPQWVRGSVQCQTIGVLGQRTPQPDMVNRTGSWCDQGDGICNQSALLPGTHTTAYRGSQQNGSDGWIAQSAAEIVSNARVKIYRAAFNANNGAGYLYTYDSSTGAINTTQGMKSGTSPSIAYVSGSGYEEAFQANTGNLFVYGSAGSYDTQQGMMAGASPSIAANLSGGFRVAFQANNGNLYYYDSATGAANTGQGMKSGTSPAIAALSTGGYEMTFQANTGNLFVYGSAGSYDTQQGMMAGTSPSIAPWSNGGSYRVAFQANTGNLYYYDSSSGAANTQQGMASGTSPSIARVSGGYEMAFQANTGNLFVNGSGGSYDTQQGVKSGTSPAIAAASSGGFRVAFNANNGTGYLYTYDSSGGTSNTQQGVTTGTSPSIAP